MRGSSYQEGRERRAFFRKSLSLPVEARVFWLPPPAVMPKQRALQVKVANVGGGGMLLNVKRTAQAGGTVCQGALLDLSLSVPGALLPLRILARVIRAEEAQGQTVPCAVEFLLLSPKETDTIVRLVSQASTKAGGKQSNEAGDSD